MVDAYIETLGELVANKTDIKKIDIKQFDYNNTKEEDLQFEFLKYKIRPKLDKIRKMDKENDKMNYILNFQQFQIIEDFLCQIIDLT